MFDIDARGKGSTFRVALSLGSEKPPHPNVRITAEFIAHSAVQRAR